MTRTSIDSGSGDEQFTEILAEFSRTFGSRSSRLSNIRSISKSALISEILDLRKRLPHPLPRASSGQATLERLIKSGLVHPLALIQPDREQSTDRFFSIGLRESDAELDPVELLQAMVPEGAICYFTAVNIHELSTQMPTHHHVARIVDTVASPNRPRLEALPQCGPKVARSQRRNRLGRLQFFYGGIPYYVTTRQGRRVPGVQKRFYTDKTVYSVTTYEQTLLDTLERPLSCGGSSVVFEAWNRGARQLDQGRLLHHLKAIGDHKLTRRVGYMLQEHVQHELQTQLMNYLHRVRTRSIKDGTTSLVSLLPGYEYGQTNLDWGLEVP